MRSKVEFQTNVPVRVAFEQPGTLSAGRYGDQYQYWLTGDRIMWVPPIVHNEIMRLEIQPGEEFDICKAETMDGRKKVVRWHVGVIGDAFDRHADRAPSAHGEMSVPRQRQPEQGSRPAPAAAASEQLPSQPQITSRREKMTGVLVDCFRAVEDAATATGTKLDGAQFQALISTLYIQEGRLEEQRCRYAGSLPPAQHTPNPRPNGANGATTWNH